MSDIALSGFSSPKVTGSGNLKIGDTWKALYDAGQTFSPDTPDLVTASLDATSTLSIGGGSLAFTGGGSISVGSRLRLFWPNPKREKDPLLDVTLVDPDFDTRAADRTGPLALLLILEGKVALTGNAPALKTGALAASLDLKAGGDLDYARLIVGEQSDSVRSLLDRMVSGFRLPQDPTPLADGEAIALTYGGYVKFTSSLTWGYALSGTKDVGAGSFASTVAYNAKIGPRLSLAAEAAGRFSFITRALPGQPGWVRLSVHKSLDDSVDVAFDLGVEASYDVKGGWVDRSLYESVALLFGLDPQAVAKAVKQLGDAPTLEQIPTVLNGVFAKEISALVAKWSAANDAAGIARKIGSVADAYVNLDKTVHAYIADQLSAPAEKLTAEIDALTAPKVLADSLGMPNSPVWQKLGTWFADKASDWLRSSSPVTAAQTALADLKQQVLTAADAGVHDFMAAFDPAQKLQGLLTELAAIKSEADFQNNVSAQLQTLISHLLEKPYAALAAAGPVKDAFAALQNIQKQVAGLQDRWAEFVKKAAAQKFTGQFAASYKRADSGESLLEADFRLPQAKDWYEEAVKGDFTKLLNAPGDSVRLQSGTLERDFSRESTFSIAVFGSTLASTFKITQKSTIKLESNAAGQIAIDTTETAAVREDTQDWFGDREQKLSRLAFLSSGPVTSNPKLGLLIGANVTIGVNYNLSIEDGRTSADELRAYLQFAEELGLTATARTLADKLIALLQPADLKNIGKLEATYAVSFAPDMVSEVFNRLNPFAIRDYASVARRRYYERFYATRRSDLPVIGIAYNYREGVHYPMKEWFDGNVHHGQVASTIFQAKRVPMPDGKDALIGFHSDTLVRLYTTEARGVAALMAFDGVADRVANGKPVTDDEFNQAVRELVEARESIDVFLPANYSAFFAMIDSLAAVVSDGHASARRSKLDLKLTPNKPGASPVTLTLAS